MAFKMKRTPIKGKLDNFFSSLGKKATSDRQTKQVQENQGMTNFEKRQADKAAERKSGGKSKFQRAVVKRKARKKLKPGEFTTKRKLEGNLVPNQELMEKKVKKVDVAKPDYSSMSVNALVKLREKGNKDVQSTINTKLKKDPNKWD